MLAPIIASPSTAGAALSEPDIGAQWLDLFNRRTLEESRVSASTREAYTLDMAMLVRWVTLQRKDLLHLTTADLRDYLGQRLAQGISLSTLARHLSTCRRFYAFLQSHGVLAANPATNVHLPQVIPHAPRLVPEAVVQVLLRPQSHATGPPGSTFRARRDHAIVCMLYGTTLGISDIRVLRWPQIDDQRRLIHVPRRHGEVRSFGLDDRLLATLKALRAGAEGPYCFPTASGLPMTRQALSHAVRKWARECGYDEAITPSALRHTGRAHHAQRRGLPAARAGG